MPQTTETQKSQQPETASQIDAALTDIKAGKVGRLGGLLLELFRKGTSTGRLAFVATMGLALYMWSPLGGVQDIPSSMQTVLMVILGYVLGGKAVSVWRSKGHGSNPENDNLLR